MTEEQCRATLETKRGQIVTIVWCLKRKGHRGDHRGDRVQWTRQGKKVSITEPIPKLGR